MEVIRSWMVVAWFILRYRIAALRGKPRVMIESPDIYDEVQTVVDAFVKWKHNMKIVGERHCPVDHPTVVVGNHMKLDDPVLMFCASYLDTGGKVRLSAMSRDDFFVGTVFKTPLFDVDDFFMSIHVHEVSRGHITLSQLRPFLDELAKGGSFIMFPGHTRSRSGLFMEYRDDFQEPGGVSFFVHQTRRRHPELEVSATPLVRTFNPVSERSAMIYGPEQFIEGDATREEQRDFDFRLVEVMAQLIEVNVAQVLSAILYLRCLHGLMDNVSVAELERTVASVLERTDHPYVDPEGVADVPKAVDDTLEYLEKHGMLRGNMGGVRMNRKAVLSTPELDSAFKKKNPVKYLTNQILHLGEVTALIEDVTLGGAKAAQSV